jgi:hypothetical protein
MESGIVRVIATGGYKTLRNDESSTQRNALKTKEGDNRVSHYETGQRAPGNCLARLRRGTNASRNSI